MNTLSIKNILFVILAVVVGSWAVYTMTQQAFGAITIDNPTQVNTYQTYDFFASTTAQTGTVSSTVLATTTTATSTSIISFVDSTYGRYVDGSFSIRGAKKVTIYFTRGGATSPNTGTSTFRIQTTKDGTTWDDYNQLVSATSTSVSNTLVQSNAYIQAATSTLIFGMDLDYTSYKAIRCIVVETIDGEHQCSAAAQF